MGLIFSAGFEKVARKGEGEAIRNFKDLANVRNEFPSIEAATNHSAHPAQSVNPMQGPSVKTNFMDRLRGANLNEYAHADARGLGRLKAIANHPQGRAELGKVMGARAGVVGAAAAIAGGAYLAHRMHKRKLEKAAGIGSGLRGLIGMAGEGITKNLSLKPQALLNANLSEVGSVAKAIVGGVGNAAKEIATHTFRGQPVTPSQIAKMGTGARQLLVSIK